MDIGNEAQDLFAQQTLPAAVPDHLANAAPTLNHQSARGESARVNSHHTPHAGDNRALVQADRQQAFRRSDNTDGGVESFDDIIGGIGKGPQGNAHLSEQVSVLRGVADAVDLHRLLRSLDRSRQSVASRHLEQRAGAVQVQRVLPP